MKLSTWLSSTEGQDNRTTLNSFFVITGQNGSSQERLFTIFKGAGLSLRMLEPHPSPGGSSIKAPWKKGHFVTLDSVVRVGNYLNQKETMLCTKNAT